MARISEAMADKARPETVAWGDLRFLTAYAAVFWAVVFGAMIVLGGPGTAMDIVRFFAERISLHALLIGGACGFPAGALLAALADRVGNDKARCKMVECPACAGAGEIYPGATVGMWLGLVPWNAQPEPCELCGGTGEVSPEIAAEYEEYWEQ